MREETPKEKAAREAFEDAASRGFPNGDQVRLQTAIYIARAEADAADALMEAADLLRVEVAPEIAATAPAAPVGTPPVGSSVPDLSPSKKKKTRA